MNKFKAGDVIQVVKSMRAKCYDRLNEGIVGGYYIGEIFVIKHYDFDNQYYCYCNKRNGVDRTDYRVDYRECVLISEGL